MDLERAMRLIPMVLGRAGINYDGLVKSLLQTTLSILGEKHLECSALKNANCLIRRGGEFSADASLRAAF
jgi:hypothetical protein